MPTCIHRKPNPALSRLTMVLVLIILSCSGKKSARFESDLNAIHLKKGEIALCGSIEGKFGTVTFNVNCLEKVKANFNLATALLHSFEYDEAEKAFAKVIAEDPACVMAYWGVAMSNFHALWGSPGAADLEKGWKAIGLARTLGNSSERESDYLEAVAAFYADYNTLDHTTRLLKFEKAMAAMYNKYPDDKEAAIFYALALNATANPADKTFKNQIQAGEILNSIYPGEPNHPGVAHYIIHNYDYPELANRALSAARSYAAIAPASAHAQHMPSHIFTRLGLWDESITSNLNSTAAAKCYAENAGIKGHWDEELHGIDYLVYAYLQQGNDEKADSLVSYLKSMNSLSAENGKSAYVLAAVPARWVIERKKWNETSQLNDFPRDFPWDQFPWENALTHFVKLIGWTHLGQLGQAQKELITLESLHDALEKSGDPYKANQVLIQIKAGQAWIAFGQGRKEEAIKYMKASADMEDATGKHPVTPGEVVPARELLGDLFLELEDAQNALLAYEADLLTHSNRFNGLAGAALSAVRIKDYEKASGYYQQLLSVAGPDNPNQRPELQAARDFLKKQENP